MLNKLPKKYPVLGVFNFAHFLSGTYSKKQIDYTGKESIMFRRKNIMSLRNAIIEEKSWGLTANGAVAKVETGNACLDMFGRAGAMRGSDVQTKQLMFAEAFNEDADIATKLLFYIRDIRGGYGERDTFTDMLRKLAEISPSSVAKNLWAVLEYGRAKDLYCLVGTPAEDDMWTFVKNQFELDIKNMGEGKSISLLAKWLATPDSKSNKTRALGITTAKKLGYSFKTMREYKDKLRALRAYLDLPEAKMCTGKWDQIEYSKCASQFMLKNRKAIIKHDAERYQQYIQSVNAGEEKMNMSAATPVDIVHNAVRSYSSELETMWRALPDVCDGNALCMIDTSRSMTSGYYCKGSVTPMEVAVALGMYFAERNKGDLANLFMTFSSNPAFVEFKGGTLKDKYDKALGENWGMSTNLEAAFALLLNTCINGDVTQDEMPDAIVIVSDMQINCVKGVGFGNRITFYDSMKRRYAEAGYEMPHVVFWNVNAAKATFHASKTNDGVSLVSGYSPNVFRDVMNNIGTTPYELMMAIVNSERYADIKA